MNADLAPGDDRKPAEFPLLERITAGVLILVIATLAWIILAAHDPSWGQWATTEVQVVVVLALLTTALVLVSVLALLQTRG